MAFVIYASYHQYHTFTSTANDDKTGARFSYSLQVSAIHAVTAKLWHAGSFQGVKIIFKIRLFILL